jgi:protein gp37
VADHTHIEWTDATWNPITGCSVVSAGCKHCYAMKLAGTHLQHHPSRAGLTVDTKAGPVWNGQVRLNEDWLDQPLKWKRPRRIFVCAHGDLFHESVPDEWIDKVFAVMMLAPQHTFQVLTKRPERALEYLTTKWQPAPAQDVEIPGVCTIHVPAEAVGDTRRDIIVDTCYQVAGSTKLDERAGFWRPDDSAEHSHTAWPLPNVWLGVSVENQAAADERIPLLLATPAAVRWISAEPLLGPVDLKRHLFQCCGCPHPGDPGDGFYDPPSPPSCCNEPDLTELHWVVAGGESGTGARPMHPDWARSLRDQCAAAGVPFLFKQWGAWAPKAITRCGQNIRFPGDVMDLVGKKAAGRLLDGVQHDSYPERANG